MFFDFSLPIANKNEFVYPGFRNGQMQLIGIRACNVENFRR